MTGWSRRDDPVLSFMQIWYAYEMVVCKSYIRIMRWCQSLIVGRRSYGCKTPQFGRPLSLQLPLPKMALQTPKTKMPKQPQKNQTKRRYDVLGPKGRKSVIVAPFARNERLLEEHQARARAQLSNNLVRIPNMLLFQS
jgi:hypothetical protein